MKPRAFTLLEVLLVAALIIAISGPIWRIFQRGTKNALKGMVQIDTTLEVSKIIRQIHYDLKFFCFLPENLPELEGKSDREIEDRWNVIFKVGGSPAFPTFSFYSFPVHGKIDDAISAKNTTEIAFRKPVLITYKLEKIDQGSLVSRLVREEGGKSRVLSEKIAVRTFYIERPLGPGNNTRSFWVNLQIVDFVPGANSSGNANAEKKVILAEFFDVVTPDFYSQIFNHPTISPNWHTRLQP